MCFFYFVTHQTPADVRGVRFGQKWTRLAPNGTNQGLINTSFLFILPREHRAKINRKLLLKSLRFVPFGANLAQFESKPATRAPDAASRRSQCSTQHAHFTFHIPAAADSVKRSPSHSQHDRCAGEPDFAQRGSNRP